MSQQEPDGEDGFAANVVREAVQRVLIHQATPLATQLRRYRRRSPIPLEQSSSNYREIERAFGHCSILEQQSFLCLISFSNFTFLFLCRLISFAFLRFFLFKIKHKSFSRASTAGREKNCCSGENADWINLLWLSFSLNWIKVHDNPKNFPFVIRIFRLFVFVHHFCRLLSTTV